MGVLVIIIAHGVQLIQLLCWTIGLIGWLETKAQWMLKFFPFSYGLLEFYELDLKDFQTTCW